MANEEEEEVVILETDDSPAEEEEQFTELNLEGEDGDPIEEELAQEKYQEEVIEAEKRKKRNLILLSAGIGILVLIIIILIILIITSLNKEQKPAQNTNEIIEKLQKKEPSTKFTPSKIDMMLQRANALYENGNKMEALDIYENVATYNESISQYNMGVAQMKEENFKSALISFKNAIINNENRTVSSINAAVCALKLKDKKLFDYYLNLAYTYLPQEHASPLYSYYSGLINYYKGNYYEALATLTHPSSKFYVPRQDYLASKIFTYLDSSYLALDSIQAQNQIPDDLTRGLLYARIGEYSLAHKYLSKAVKEPSTLKRASIALALVNIKLGNFASASNALHQNYEENTTEATSFYPIKATLNKSFFNIDIAQEDAKEDIFLNKNNQYKLLFYFAPYKVFDAKQTINYIRKGGMNVFVDEIDSGLDYLKASSTIAKINTSMAKIIKTAINHHYLQANREFKKLAKEYSKHTILHYNLALTYAQLGNYSLSYKHFLSSYRLNTKNYLAGLFAVMSGELIGKDVDKLREEVKLNIDQDNSLKKINFFMTMSHMIENNELSMNRWLEQDRDKSPLHLMFDIICANITSNDKQYLQKADELKTILPKDIVANIINFHATYKDKDAKAYAKAVQIKLMSKDLDMDAFYYGSNLVKEEYVKLLQVSGLLYKKRDELKNQLQTESNDVVGIMQALAYLDIYTNNFEESYMLYNQLIDEHDQQDTNTVFLGAVASIGAKHPENAIALLELSKLTDPNNLESRYGLGLLYQEVKNYEGASIQYKNIGDSGFKSKYFSFKIVD